MQNSVAKYVETKAIQLSSLMYLYLILASEYHKMARILFIIKVASQIYYVRMAERSKAPDSRVKPLSLAGVFWSTYVGVGSNPTSDNFFKTPGTARFVSFSQIRKYVMPYHVVWPTAHHRGTSSNGRALA